MTRIRGPALGPVIRYTMQAATHTGNCQYLSCMSEEEILLVGDLLAPSVDLSKYMIKAPRAGSVLREAADLCDAKNGR